MFTGNNLVYYRSLLKDIDQVGVAATLCTCIRGEFSGSASLGNASVVLLLYVTSAI
jgi:hypothetical protein